IDVSVKKPSGFSCQAISLKPHQVPHDLGVAALGGGQIERDRGELVDDGHGARLAMLIDRDEIAAADLAGVHAQGGKAAPRLDDALEVAVVEAKEDCFAECLGPGGD